MTTKIGNAVCACGCDKVPVTEGKGGSLSGKCPECGAQSFARSPTAVNAWKKKIAGTGGKPAARLPADDDLLNI